MTPDKIRKCITLSVDMNDRLAAAAAEDGCSMSEVVRRALVSRFEATAGDESLVRDLRAFRASEFKRRPLEVGVTVQEAVDALVQMQMDPHKATLRCAALAVAHPEADAAGLIELALKVEN